MYVDFESMKSFPNKSDTLSCSVQEDEKSDICTPKKTLQASAQALRNTVP